MQTNSFSRRTFLTGASLTFAATVFNPIPALALTSSSAKAMVDKLVIEINRVISSGRSEDAMLQQFEKLFVQYSDVPIMARYSLGADARRATKQQMAAFTTSYQRYISRKYGRRFREFIGGRIEVRDARKIKAGYEVRTTAYLSGESPFEVTFLVSDKSGQDKFFNIFIEGVNMLLTERTEIGAMLDRRGGDLDKMISDLGQLR
jgi:phospholipid transport system substrate-binding protein